MSILRCCKLYFYEIMGEEIKVVCDDKELEPKLGEVERLYASNE